jgi:hypothetical protein
MLRTRIWALLVLTVLSVAACGAPSYDLIVHVTEADGTAIPEASVQLAGLQEVQVTDEAGQVQWTRLDEDSAVLHVVAVGFTMHASRVDLERGSNKAVIALEREPIDLGPVGP